MIAIQVEQYPVDMRVHSKSQGFGEHPENYTRFGIKGHNGLDLYPLDGGKDHKVFSVSSGKIKKVANDSGWGNYVDVSHSWGMSRYAHLKRYMVQVGQVVDLTTVLGIEDSTGNSTGTHLHLGIYPIGIPSSNGYAGAVDPLIYLDSAARVPLGILQLAAPSQPDIPPVSLQAGFARVVGANWLNIRLQPDDESIDVGDLLNGSVVKITNETVVDTPWVYRGVVLYVLEHDDKGNVYLAQEIK